MRPVKEFDSAELAREPIHVKFSPTRDYPDGREFTFDGDFRARDFLKFVRSYDVTGNMMALEIIEPFVRLVTGDQFDQVEEQLSVSEMNELAGYLWVEYVVRAGEDAGGGAAGKVLASMTSSTNGRT